MHYYRLDRNGDKHLLARTERPNSHFYDLTSATRELRSFCDIVKVAKTGQCSIDGVADRYLEEADTLDRDQVIDDLALPVQLDEVWAAGVTYEISEEARKTESTMPEIYLDAYRANRPEIFFKATPDRTVGPNEPVGIREDSTWDVPEPELGVVLHYGDIVGYTIGNDMSSRAIEGQNPLYLPQAKVYDRSCAIGPCVVTEDGISDPHNLEMSMRIERNGSVVFEGSTSTSKMVRSCPELVSYYRRHNSPPKLVVLLTGTSIVPDKSFTLAPNDVVDITVDSIGTLRNPVVTV